MLTINGAMRLDPVVFSEHPSWCVGPDGSLTSALPCLPLGTTVGELADSLRGFFRGYDGWVSGQMQLVDTEDLDGAVIDFHDDLNKRGFTVSNPQAKSTCGCGSSYSM